MLAAGYALIAIGTTCLAFGLFVLWLGSLSDDRIERSEAWNRDMTDL